MSALRKSELVVQEQQDTEVIYLLIPPTTVPSISTPRPLNFIEKLALVGEQARFALHRAGNYAFAVYFAVAATIAVGYSLYNLKSFAGINIFSNARLEDFAPLPGFNR